MRTTPILALLLATTPAWAAPPLGEPAVMGAAPATYRDAMLSGGPGKDGIPSIDAPRFQSAAAADDYLEPGDRVIGVYHEGVARAYPQRILVWHEIVNDTLAGDPVSITYCPLTGTALGFHRGATEFGVSGRLVNSNLVMYDRASDSLYPQILAAGIQGPSEGRGLEELRVVFTEWASWKQRHPDTEVLSTETGHMRNYQRDPYGAYNPKRGYYAPGSRRMFPVLNEDERYPAKHEVLGFRDRHGAVAVDLERLAKEAVIHTSANGQDYVVIHDPVLDTGWVYRGAADVDADDVAFTEAGPRFPGQDALEPVNAFRAMWFAWAAFYPQTTVIGDDAAGA
ncbi:MAG: DUF3179 domain-containing protein [Halofilum sp. (in: g-proteobacteria)]|nr:DUF3179 domain-containing protein [Halofilum sp. (in: g-proteobacteria)]